MKAKFKKNKTLANIRKQSLATAGITSKVKNTESKEAFIQSLLDGSASRSFLSDVEKYGRTEKGDPIQMSPWYGELLGAIADMRIAHICTSGPAQIGKTLSHTLLFVWLLVRGKFNIGWWYDSKGKRDMNVPEQFNPVITSWIEHYKAETGINLKKASDAQNMSRYQLDGASAFFSYASTNKQTKSREGLAAAGSASVSQQVNFMVREERSQWAPGTADPLARRLDASCIPTEPIRDLGTPGAGAGIEHEIKSCDRVFYPHYKCPHCGVIKPLDPKGCLLKPTLRRDSFGKETWGYLSESGRPVEWFYKDVNKPVDSAVISCSHCGGELSLEDRTSAWFQCRNTGITLKQYQKELDRQDIRKSKRHKIALILSPLLRASPLTGSKIIRAGMEYLDSTDWQQQMLGHPSENLRVSLTFANIEECIGLPVPQRPPDATLVGIDCGRNCDWMAVVSYYLPKDSRQKTVPELVESTIREIKFCGDISRSDIAEAIAYFKAQNGFIDNEPDRESAMALCRQVKCLQLADQKNTQREPLKEIIIKDGGIEYPCFGIRSSKFLDAVLYGFLLRDINGMPLYRLPQSWDIWKANNSERSPFKHLTSMEKRDGKWQRDKSGNDDLFHALHFAEAAFYLWLNEERNNSGQLLKGVLNSKFY